MHYKLYTLIDITQTKQYRLEPQKEVLYFKEQNFNTILQTLGLRSNIYYDHGPVRLEVGGKIVGFDTEDIIRVWRFDWYTERSNLYLDNDDPLGFLKKDFNLVPYIKGLEEQILQNPAVFLTYGENRNIVFHLK